MDRNLAALALSLLMCLAPIAANSTVNAIPAGAQQTLWAENQGGSDPWFYTHATETWSFSTHITGRFFRTERAGHSHSA
jgi:hypothetical protein